MNSEREELIEALRKTRERFGALYPVLVDSEGNVIDGKHRLEACPDWPKITVETGTPIEAKILRVVANMVRRDVSPEEKREALNEIAQATGWTPKEIAENLGVSYRWVTKYLSPEHKDQKMRELAHRRSAKKPSLEEKAREMGIELPTPSRVPTSTCPLCGCSAPAEVIALKYEEFKYGEPELTVVQLMERKRRGGSS